MKQKLLYSVKHKAITMKHKLQNNSKLKLLLTTIILCVLVYVMLLLISSLSIQQRPAIKASQTPECMKLPASLANTIIHYTTSNITPQQTLSEISITAQVLQQKSPCNFLVFGLGHDSLMWSALNQGGRTVFFEEDQSWIETISKKFPTLESYHVKYDTKVSQAEDLLGLRTFQECTTVHDPKFSKCPLSVKELPSVFYEVEWDLIMVDAPTGWTPNAPGRMGAIYSAGMTARWRSEGDTDVFVHDVDRVVEDKFSVSFLCDSYLKEQEGRLRHFIIPSHRNGDLENVFCP